MAPDLPEKLTTSCSFSSFQPSLGFFLPAANVGKHIKVNRNGASHGIERREECQVCCRHLCRFMMMDLVPNYLLITATAGTAQSLRFFGSHAVKTGGGFAVARPFVLGNLLIGAKRTRHGSSLLRVICHIFRGDDLLWGLAVFHPLLEGVQHIVIRVVGLRS